MKTIAELKPAGMTAETLRAYLPDGEDARQHLGELATEITGLYEDEIQEYLSRIDMGQVEDFDDLVRQAFYDALAYRRTKENQQ